MTCALCQSNNGNYDMSLTCCRVRFLLNEPRLEVRRAWLERWEKKYGSAEVAAIKEEFEPRWLEKKKKGGE